MRSGEDTFILTFPDKWDALTTARALPFHALYTLSTVVPSSLMSAFPYKHMKYRDSERTAVDIDFRIHIDAFEIQAVKL